MNWPAHPSTLRIEDFTYSLPEEKIAKFPLSDRDHSKLLVCRGSHFQEENFWNLAHHIPEKSILVFNSSKVISARLNFLVTATKRIEVFCLEPSESIDPSLALQEIGPQRWNCLVGNLKAWKAEKLFLRKEGLELQAHIVQKLPTHVIIEFNWNPSSSNFSEVLNVLGEVPIPPYLNRSSREQDKSSYQTVYANREGSVAAPTAGLHFTERVLNSLNQKQVSIQYLHLHVGAGTFKPVKSDRLKEHNMHTEWLEVDKSFIEMLANSGERKVFSVGTTSLRTLESLYWMGIKTLGNPSIEMQDLEIQQWDAYDLPDKKITHKASLSALIQWMERKGLDRMICKTGILIAPPYRLRVANGLLTNFHQPQSTLLLLVAAVLGEDWKKAYEFALTHNFRFLSYGDAMLILM